MSRIVIGVDEVGRGCLAGPVVAGAVVLPSAPRDWFDEIKDSKKLTPKKRAYLADLITTSSAWSLKEVPAYKIDEMNILRATLWAMKEAVTELAFQFCGSSSLEDLLILVDGPHRIPTEEEAGPGWLGLPIAQEAIKGGDDLHKAIGAASIIAKVYRDNNMAVLGELFPEYGFAKHKGYGTAQHREAIMVHGPCPLHRRTFKGVYEYVKSEGVS